MEFPEEDTGDRPTVPDVQIPRFYTGTELLKVLARLVPLIAVVIIEEEIRRRRFRGRA